MVDAYGVPLSLIVSGANRHDVKLLRQTLEGILVKRPSRRRRRRKQHLCADKAYVGKDAESIMRKKGYQPHVRQIGEEGKSKKKNPRYRARRWVVERTHSWLNRYRKILVRYEKKVSSYLALLQLACGLIAWRQVLPIYG